MLLALSYDLVAVYFRLGATVTRRIYFIVAYFLPFLSDVLVLKLWYNVAVAVA